MGVITGHRAWNEGLITGGVLNNIQPASVDVRLAEKLLIPVAYKTVDPLYGVRYEAAFLSDIDSYIIKPGEFILPSTIEKVELSETVVATFEGKSSLGRLGLGTHVTAGFIDPGFRGTITVELHNVAPYGIMLRKGMAIGQICFQRMEEPAIPYGSYYGSTYQGQDGPVGYRVANKRLITDEDGAQSLFDFVNGAA